MDDDYGYPPKTHVYVHIWVVVLRCLLPLLLLFFQFIPWISPNYDDDKTSPIDSIRFGDFGQTFAPFSHPIISPDFAIDSRLGDLFAAFLQNHLVHLTNTGNQKSNGKWNGFFVQQKWNWKLANDSISPLTIDHCSKLLADTRTEKRPSVGKIKRERLVSSIIQISLSMDFHALR